MMRGAVSIIAALLFAVPCQAQLSFGDSDEPILISADKATYRGNKTVLEGNVDVRQGTARIQSETMDIFRQKAGDDETGFLSLGAVTRIVAKGKFRYTTPENTVTGQTGVYVRRTGLINVTGEVTVSQPGGSKLSGDKLVYDIARKRAKFGEDCQGDNCDGRVQFSINNGN